MNNETADRIVSWMMIPLGLLGLLIWARALDAEMYVFGLSLTLFSTAFGFAQIKRHYDDADLAGAHAAAHRGGQPRG